MLAEGSPARRPGQDGAPDRGAKLPPEYGNEAGVEALALPAQLRTLDSVPVVLCHATHHAARLADVTLHLLL